MHGVGRAGEEKPVDALIATVDTRPDHVVGIILITVMLGLGGAGGALVCIAVQADAESADWSSFPSMTYPRAWPETVTLPNGDVLAIGGLSVLGPTATVEVFDPDDASWSPGPTMTSRRLGHTATLLDDGTVLVAGGETGAGATSSADIIDLTTGAAYALPDMNFARTGHSAAKLADGRVLVSGGTDWVTGTRTEAEIYDPGTHSWLYGGSMLRPRMFFSMWTLDDGSVLAAAGDASGTSEVYDPRTNSWGDEATMAKKRYDFASVVTSTGEVLVAGGLSDGVMLRSSEIYDHETNSWYSSGSMTVPRAHFTLSLLADGKVLAAGSWSSTTGATATAEVFCQCKMTWSTADSMLLPRGAHGSADMADGSVLLIGGRSSTAIMASAELYTPPTEEPEPPPPPPPPPPPSYCEPIDILPFVIQVAPEMPGHSAHGLIAKILVAQSYFEDGNIEDCLHILTAFYNEVRAFLGSGHMTEDGAESLYDAYAAVVECLGGTPQPELP
jgi:hypothetical protein